MRIGGFDFHTVMPRAGGDEQIAARRSFSGTAAAVGQFAGGLPYFVVDGQFGDDLFVFTQHFALRIAPDARPKLQPDDGAPAGFPAGEERLDFRAQGRLSFGPELMHPEGGIEQLHNGFGG